MTKRKNAYVKGAWNNSKDMPKNQRYKECRKAAIRFDKKMGRK